MRWGYPLVEIGDLVSSIKKWNPRQSKTNELIDYIDIASVNRETKEVENILKVLAHEAPSRARQLVMKGDVLVSTVRPNLNAVVHLKTELDGATASTGFTVLRANYNKVCDRYLYYWVRSPYFVQDMVRRSTGASYPAVSDSIVKAYNIPLPPLEEQKRIATILDKADGIRRKRKEAIALTEELLRSTFLDMFGDPVTNPKGWKIESLEKVSIIQSGIAKGKKVNPSEAILMPYIRVANVQDEYLNLDEIKELEVSSKDVNRYLLQSGDLLLTEGGDPDKLGRGAIWYGHVDPCLHQNHIFAVRPQKDIAEPEYLSALIGSKYGKRYFLRAAKQTTGIATINKTQLKCFPTLLPPINLQKKYTKFVQSLSSAKVHYSTIQHRTENLFNSLLQKAFRGEL